MKIEPERIRRLHFGYIVAPEGTSNAGQPIPVCGQPIPVCGYLIEHPRGRILFDTGISPFGTDEQRQAGDGVPISTSCAMWARHATLRRCVSTRSVGMALIRGLIGLAVTT